ncbi:MAG TPA: TonB family protein [Candidatus Sulfotelmatobacter sp.]|nr:TonB family protein [Candidatus Sulfotelmatobacter sp.]
MTQPFRLPDPSSETPSGDEKPSRGSSLRFAGAENDELNQVAKTLAEHGGGAVAFDLALDLVLNEIVEQARSATGATGAAIALTRDGEMVCRATTGVNAPDLGMRAEMNAGLSGACLKSGDIQHCSDTETDPRVNAEACRQLGVRSMLIAPVSDGQQCFGILEVLATRANAFGPKDVNTLRVLARRVAENKREAEEGTLNPAEAPEVAFAEIRSEPQEHAEQSFAAEEISAEPTADQLTADKKSEAWTSVLVVLVIAVAVLLGVIIGWRRAVLGRRVVESHQVAAPSATSVNPQASSAALANNPTSSTGAGSNQTGSAEKPKTTHAQNSVPVGGLLVTENGKVIYRVEPANPVRTAGKGGAGRSSTSRLIHQVEPEYPPEARAKGIQGPVVLDVQVQGDGRVGTVNVVSGDPMLSEAAVKAVKQWVYQPFSVDGKPVERQTRITIRFTQPSS